jgi:hypothetical protein
MNADERNSPQASYPNHKSSIQRPQRNGDRPNPALGQNRGVYRFMGTSGEIVLRRTEGVIGKRRQRTEPGRQGRKNQNLSGVASFASGERPRFPRSCQVHSRVVS